MNQPMTLEQVAEFIRAGEFRGNAYAEQAAATVEAAALDVGAAEVLAEIIDALSDSESGCGNCPLFEADTCKGRCRRTSIAYARAEAERRREQGGGDHE